MALIQPNSTVSESATGPGVFWTDEVSSLADAREVLTRYSDFYQTHTLKQYMVGDRMQRQWTLIAAKEQGITPTLEGGLDFGGERGESLWKCRGVFSPALCHIGTSAAFASNRLGESAYQFAGLDALG